MMKKPKMPKVGGGMKDGMAMPRFGARAMRPGGMAKGGGVHPDAAMDKKLIRKEIARAEKMEDKAEDKGTKKMLRGGMVQPGSLAAAAGNKSGPARAMPAPPPRPRVTNMGPGNMPRPVANPGPVRGNPGSMISPATGQPIGNRTGNMGPTATQGRMMKKGGVAKMARGGGVETKGKTKGKFI